MQITGPTPPLKGTTSLPGDKSISHRALMHAALSPHVSTIHNLLDAGVTRAMINVLRQCGIQIEQNGSTFSVRGGRFQDPNIPLDCGNSGTTMRLLMGAMAGQDRFEAVLTGTPGLQRRPMDRVAEPLNNMGATIAGKTAPISLRGGKLRGLTHTTKVASAQVKAAILLAGLQATGPTVIHEPGPSRDHSERMLRGLGINVQSSGNTITLVPPHHPLPPTNLTVPGDISSAAFLIAAAAIVPGSHITLAGVGINPTRTGLLDALREMGASLTLDNRREVGGEPVADLTIRQTPLHGIEVGGDLVVRMIDEFPIFAVVASQAQGTTRVRDAAELRLKETDRIARLAEELRKLGLTITEHQDGFALTGPQTIQPAQTDSHRDHRLAMSMAVAGLLAEGVSTVANAEVVNESFPGFAERLRRLGATVSG